VKRSALSSAWLLAGLPVCLVTVTLLAGCAGESQTVSESQDVAKSAPPSPPPAPEPPPPPPEPPPPPKQEEMVAQAAAPPEDPLAWAAGLEDVHFDYNQSKTRKESRSHLDLVVQKLKENSNRKVIVEGHCDDRGTDAYNMALGERRAKSVKQYLVKAGVSASQIEVVSYGKERPQCTEATKECFQYNRRVHFAAQ